MTILSASYITEALGWTALGFLAGYLVGRTARDVHRIARSMPQEETTVDDHPDERRHRPSAQFYLGLLVVCLGILTVAQGLLSDIQTRHLTDCQSSYSNAAADALDARSKASSAAQDAMDTLITDVASSMQSPPSPAVGQRIRASINDYVAARQAAKQELAAHPLPPAPRTCQ